MTTATATRPTSTSNSGTSTGTTKRTPRSTTNSNSEQTRKPMPKITENSSVEELVAALKFVLEELKPLKEDDPKAAKLDRLANNYMRRITIEIDPADIVATGKLKVQMKSVKDFLEVKYPEEIEAIHESISELQGVAVSHTVAINNTNDRVDRIETTMASLSKKALIVIVLVSITVGVVVAMAYNAIDFTPAPLLLQDGTKIVQSSTADSPAVVIAIGFAATLATFGLLIFFVRGKRTEVKTRKLDVPKFDAPEEEMADEPTPTKVITTDAGAESSRQ